MREPGKLYGLESARRVAPPLGYKEAPVMDIDVPMKSRKCWLFVSS